MKKISLKKIVDEIIDNAANCGGEVTPSKPGYVFTVNGYKYRVEIYYIEGYDNIVGGTFKLLNNPKKAVYDKNNPQQFYIDKHKEEFGDANIKVDHLEVLNEVIGTFLRYIKKYKPDKFVFDAFSNRRVTLYKKFVKKYLKSENLGDEYTLTNQKNNDGSVQFCLVKKDEKNINEAFEYLNSCINKDFKMEYFLKSLLRESPDSKYNPDVIYERENV